MTAPGMTITKAGEHFTLASAAQVGQALNTAGWKSGAILDPCSSISLHDAVNRISFDGVPPGRQFYLRALALALTRTGPVNVGLTNESKDGLLRAVFYFPDVPTLKKRMDAAILVLGGAL